jgi:hypothetical protein
VIFGGSAGSSPAFRGLLAGQSREARHPGQ